MKKQFKTLYLSAMHLLNDVFVISMKEEYPQAHIMEGARRGLKEACFRFDPARGVKFTSFANFQIRYFVRRCLAEEVPESELLSDRLPPDIVNWLRKDKVSKKRLKCHETRRRDAAIFIQWKKTVEQARIWRKMIKNRKRG